MAAIPVGRTSLIMPLILWAGQTFLLTTADAFCMASSLPMLVRIVTDYQQILLAGINYP
jgi:hypothetical protein